MRRLTLWIDCIPATTTAQQQTRVNHQAGRVYTSQTGSDWRSFLAGLLSMKRPDEPFSGPIFLNIAFVWPVTKGDESTKAKRERFEVCPFVWHDQKPDWDNAPKSPVDVLQKLGFFGEDKRIVAGTCVKLRGKRPGIYIDIGEASPWLLSEYAEMIEMAREESLKGADLD